MGRDLHTHLCRGGCQIGAVVVRMRLWRHRLRGPSFHQQGTILLNSGARNGGPPQPDGRTIPECPGTAMTDEGLLMRVTTSRPRLALVARFAAALLLALIVGSGGILSPAEPARAQQD